MKFLVPILFALALAGCQHTIGFDDTSNAHWGVLYNDPTPTPTSNQ